jgi:hypothetical protein
MTKAFFLCVALAMGAALPAAAQTPPAGYVTLDQLPTAESQPVANGMYEAVTGASLRATLERWAKTSGWQPVVWKLPEDTDFTLGGSGRFEGDFITATRAFVDSLGPEADLRVRFNQGNRLVVVEPQP